jgi:hypothetical protein
VLTLGVVIVLISLCEPDIDATAQRALLSALRNDTVGKLALRKETQRAKAVERLAVNPGSGASPCGGGIQAQVPKEKRVETNEVIYDDPSTHARVCCEDFDTDCEPEYPCDIVANHCATCANPWDATCESDSSDYHNDVGNSDNSLHCMPCGPVGRQ